MHRRVCSLLTVGRIVSLLVRFRDSSCTSPAGAAVPCRLGCAGEMPFVTDSCIIHDCVHSACAEERAVAPTALRAIPNCNLNFVTCKYF